MLLIIDLECTCWAEGHAPTLDGQQTLDVMEIIEIGAALADLDGRVLESKPFLVRPVMHPTLSDFCTALTGITQAEVDAASVFAEVVPALDAWLAEQVLDCWCSWGRGDLRLMTLETQRQGSSPAFINLPHANMMKGWQKTQRYRNRAAMRTAFRYHGLELEGRHHSGVDDARNLAQLLPFIDWDLAAKFVTDPA